MKKTVLFISLFLLTNLSINAHSAFIDIPLEGSINTNDFESMEYTYEPSSNIKSKPKGISGPPIDLVIKVRVYLEGALLNNNDEMGATHERPLMRDDLRVSPFNAKRYVPDTDPYGNMNAVGWESNKARYVHVQSGLLPEFTFIADIAQVFGVSGEDAIVDWVFVELRSKSDYTNIIATRSGLLQRDGDVVDLDGVSGLSFTGVDVDDYYVAVKHRNHLGAMTAEAQTPTQLSELVDFTMAETGFFDFGNSKFGGAYDYTNLAQSPNSKNGYLALWAGDFDGNGKIKFWAPSADLNVLYRDIIGYEVLDDNGSVIEYNFFTNYHKAYGYHAGDYDLNSKAMFDNPNDDKNMVYGQLLFYPLNKQYDSLFDFFIEQIPN